MDINISTGEEYKDVIQELYDFIKQVRNIPQFPYLIELIVKMNEKHGSSPYPGELPSRELFNLLQDRLDEEPVYVKMIEKKKKDDPTYKVDFSETNNPITFERDKYRSICYFLGYMYKNDLINFVTLLSKLDEMQDIFDDNNSNDTGLAVMEGILDILVVAGKTLKQNYPDKYKKYYDFINNTCANGTKVTDNKVMVLCQEFLEIDKNDFIIPVNNIRWGLLAPTGIAVRAGRVDAGGAGDLLSGINNPGRALQFMFLPDDKNPTAERLWDDFKQYGDLEYTQRNSGRDIDTADVVFKETQSAQNALNFNTTNYGPGVTLRFMPRQPKPYDPSATQDIKGNRGARFRYTGPNPTGPNPTGKTIKTIFQNTPAGKAAAKNK